MMATTPPEPPQDLVALLRAAVKDPKQRTVLAGALVCVGLLCLLYRESLQHLFYAWSTDANYSHGFLVPFISIFFANQAIKRGPIEMRGGMFLGISFLAFSILTRLLMVHVPIPFLADLGFLVGLAGICALLGGSQLLKRLWFALTFLLFMIPLPIAIYARGASPLQMLASRIATVVLNATGVPVLCEGNMMTLPGGVQMFVAEACSGMRQLTGYLALTAAVAYLSPRPGWYRMAMIASALPIAIVANVARVILTGYIMYYVDPHYASGAYHSIEGLIMMAFGLSLLRAGCWVLDQLCAITQPAGTLPPIARTSPS